MNEIVQVEEDVWVGDLLERKAEGEYLHRYIERLYDADKKDQTSFVLNINSEWGHGKTWFLKNLCKELRKNRPVVYFDAWKNDFSNDALLSFVSVVCDELSRMFWKDKPVLQKVSKVKAAFSSVSKGALPILLSILVKQLTGKALDELNLSDNVKASFVDASDELSKVISSSAIDGFITQRNAIDEFSGAVQSLVKEISKTSDVHLPICIMVDELDRCRPTYAIELLEAIKHLFAVNGIFFILATDTKQLSHSIKAVYGEGFNAQAYLKRFFYAEYVLAPPDYRKLSNFLFSSVDFSDKFLLPSLGDVNVFFAAVSRLFKLSVRDQEQVFSNLTTVLFVSSKGDIHFPFLLLLVVMKHKFYDDYLNLMHSAGVSELSVLFSGYCKDGRCEDVALHLQKINGEREAVSVRKVFEHYMRIYDSQVYKTENLYSLKYEYKFQPEVLKALDGKELRHYFKLVEQAGRLAVNA